jgi:hypothetical protein
MTRRKVTQEQGKQYCDENKFVGFIETSAKSGSNVVEV